MKEMIDKEEDEKGERERQRQKIARSKTEHIK